MSVPLPGGPSIITTPISSRDGNLSDVWQRWYVDLIGRVQSGLDRLGNLIGNISPTVHVAGRVEPIGTTLQNLNSTGQLSTAALHGTILPTQLPTASVGAIGAVQAVILVPNQWVDSISNAGVPHLSQPGFANLSGAATAAQIPALSALNGSVTAAQVPTLDQLGGQITDAQLPANGLSVTIATAKLTAGGANGSQTFTNGILTAQTPAT